MITGKALKKPISVRFIQWTGENLLDVIRFTGQNASAMDYKWEDYEDLVERDGLKIFSLEGKHKAKIGDFILEGVNSENWVVDKDIFKKTYDILDNKGEIKDE
ncbi:MAG TPA: hypothetical protein EYN67_14625 [Flavobacteriales bacterium]|nr:hypothetical protein [Flavobacteriales bacterium]